MTISLSPLVATPEGHRADPLWRPSGSGVRVMRLANFQQVPHLRSQWERLSQRSHGDFFGTFDWCEVWWRYYGRGRDLRLLLFYARSKLVGVMPLFWERLAWGPVTIRVLRLVGSDSGVTTCSFTVDPSHLTEVGRLLTSELAAMNDWDIAQLGELPGYHESAEELSKCLVHSQWTTEFRNDNYPHMVLDLPSSFPDYLSMLRGTERHNILKRERRLRERRDLRFEIAAPDDASLRFEDFAQQHQKQWQAAGKLGHFVDWSDSLEFHRELINSQVPLRRLMLMRLKVDDQVAGYQYCYVYNKRVHFIISSRAMSRQWEYYSPGRLLHCAVVKAAIERGAHMLDSLGGYFEHKRRLGARVLGLQTITMRRRGRGAARYWLFRGLTHLMNAVYHRAWYWHVAPFLRRRFRRLCPSFLYKGLWPRFVRARFLVAASPTAVPVGKGDCGS